MPARHSVLSFSKQCKTHKSQGTLYKFDTLMHSETPACHYVAVIMAALCNRTGHYTFSLWFLLSSIFYLFPRPISAVGDWMCTILLHIVWGSGANLECRSETCCTGLAGNAGPKEIAKNSPSGHRRTNLSGYIFATQAYVDNQKKTC